jgi:hypothetical protein
MFGGLADWVAANADEPANSNDMQQRTKERKAVLAIIGSQDGSRRRSMSI